MKVSQFNIFHNYGNDVLIYNTYSSAFIKLSKNKWEKIIYMIQNNHPITDDCQKILDVLLKEEIIVPKSTNEIKLVEYHYYNKIFNERFLSLSIAPTMKCNFGCFYCFEEGNKNDGLMTDETVNKLVEYIANQNEKNINIHWFGGEPLLGFKQILNICRQLNKRNINYTSSIITNGSLLTPQKINLLGELNVQRIQISLDGIAKDHDCRRVFKNGSPSFQLIIKNLENLLQLTKIKVSIQVTVDHSNETAYKDVMEYMNTNFKHYIETKRMSIGHNYVQNRTDFYNDGLCFSPEQILWDEIKSITEKTGKTRVPSFPKLTFPCMFRRKESYAIDSQGNIYKCLEHLGNPKCKIGNLKDGYISKKKIIETSFIHLPFEDEECRKCAYLPICGGGCPIDRIKYKEGKISNCCSIHKVKLEKLLPYLYKMKFEH